MSLENRMSESDNLIIVGLNAVYPSEWSWRNAQCTRQNRLGEREHYLPTQNVNPSRTDLIHCIHHDGVGGCGSWLCGACHSSLFIPQRNLNRSFETYSCLPSIVIRCKTHVMSSVLSRNVVRKQDVRVGTILIGAVDLLEHICHLSSSDAKCMSYIQSPKSQCS